MIPIAYGVEEKTLPERLGWLTSSAALGQECVCVVYGHRNRNHQEALKNVSSGDMLLITMHSGKEFGYTIETIELPGSKA